MHASTAAPDRIARDMAKQTKPHMNSQCSAIRHRLQPRTEFVADGANQFVGFRTVHAQFDRRLEEGKGVVFVSVEMNKIKYDCEKTIVVGRQNEHNVREIICIIIESNRSDRFPHDTSSEQSDRPHRTASPTAPVRTHA